MGVKYLWDTNIAIYYLQRQFPRDAEKFMDEVVKVSHPCISAITEIELLCWRSSTEKDIDVLNRFIKDALVIELEQKIKVKAANIRKDLKIKLPDAIIAATALEYSLTLITRDIRDFGNVSDLVLVNPWEV